MCVCTYVYMYVYYVPAVVLGTGHTAVNKTKKRPCPHLYLVETSNKQGNTYVILLEKSAMKHS